MIENHQTYVFSICSGPWQGTFATRRMGMGGKYGPIFVPSITQYMIFNELFNNGFMIFDFFIQVMEHLQNVFVQFVRPPGRNLLPHWEWGWEGERTKRGQYLYHHPLE